MPAASPIPTSPHEKPPTPREKPPTPKPPTPEPQEPIRIKSLDFNFDANTREHNTDEYEITQDDFTRKAPRQLVIRRGQSFTLDLNLDRNYKKKTDEITLLMEIG